MPFTPRETRAHPAIKEAMTRETNDDRAMTPYHRKLIVLDSLGGDSIGLCHHLRPISWLMSCVLRGLWCVGWSTPALLVEAKRKGLKTASLVTISRICFGLEYKWPNAGELRDYEGDKAGFMSAVSRCDFIHGMRKNRGVWQTDVRARPLTDWITRAIAEDRRRQDNWLS